MNDQGWAALIGFGVVVGMRMLDWLFPRGYIWKRVQTWSVKAEKEDSDNP